MCFIHPQHPGSTEVSAHHYNACKGHMEGLINEDIAAVARYAAGLEFIDPKQVYVWGDSWGGYLAASAVLSHPNLFTGGICCSGIYDWEHQVKFESNLPTGFEPKMQELWMKRGGLTANPAVNPAENKRTSPAHLLALLKKPLLILHGTADDFVSVQQATIIQEQARELKIDPNLVRMKIFEGADHQFTEHQEEYYSTIMSFIDEQIAQP